MWHQVVALFCNLFFCSPLSPFPSYFRHGAYKNSWQCIKYTYKNDGFRGFYKGVTASYVGISETVIHWVIYEQLKQVFRKYHNIEHKNFIDFLSFMGAAAISKTTASCLAYPHGKWCFVAQNSSVYAKLNGKCTR